MNPDWRVKLRLHRDQARNDHMAQDENHDIGRKIIRPLMAPVLPTGWTHLHRFQERIEELGAVTGGAPPDKAAPYRIEQGMRPLATASSPAGRHAWRHISKILGHAGHYRTP